MARVLLGLVAVLGLLNRGPTLAAPGDPKAPPKTSSTAGPLTFNVDAFLRDHDKNKDGYLTRDELPADLRPRFSQLDTNKDGKISREELQKGILHLQPRRRASDLVFVLIEMSDCDADCQGEVQRAYDILRKLDTNKNGKIDPHELKAMREELVQRRLDHLFKQLDTNKDGRISRDEARGQVREDFDKIDRNKDGSIDRDELLRAATRRPMGSGTPGRR